MSELPSNGGRVRQVGPDHVCGVDEVGRGPLAGAVVAAAVILDPARPIVGLRDSKQLSPPRRLALSEQIRERALAWAVGECSVDEIDRMNILQATMLAMTRAVEALPVRASVIEVDGNRVPDSLRDRAVAIVQGDATRAAISAASILAKTVRDAQMLLLHQRFPEYGFDRHMGYPTAAHREALLRLGPCIEHRRSFAPVRLALQAAR
ncbi:MAG: ribonuclease HII [Burkholderiaceae bacterium]